MSIQIFSMFFLLLFVCSQLCEQGCAAQTAPLQAAVNLKLIDDFFKPEDNEVKKTLESPDTSQEDLSNLNVEHIDLVSLAAANGVIFAMAEMNYTFKSTERKIAVLAKHFEAKQDKWGDEAFKKMENGK